MDLRGQRDTLSVIASNGTTPYSYQWYVGISGNTTNPISGATSSTFTASPSSTTSYWVRVTDAANAVVDDLKLARPWTPVPPPEWRH